jgi:hypothetical protein
VVRDTSAELWIRSYAPVGGGESQDETLARLRDLEASGRFDDVTVRLWGKRVGVSTNGALTESGSTVRERVAAFEAWAGEADCSLAPFFERVERSSGVTGDRDEAQVLPAVALAEYRGGEVGHVAPCTDGETVVTVEDRLGELEAERDRRREAEVA